MNANHALSLVLVGGVLGSGRLLSAMPVPRKSPSRR